MFNQQPPCSSMTARDSSDIWNVTDFLEIQSIVGKDRAETLLRSYLLHLDVASASVRSATCDATRMRETVHDLKSISGQLGFEALQVHCDQLLTRGNADRADELIEPLLALIEMSTEAAQAYCLRSSGARTARQSSAA